MLHADKELDCCAHVTYNFKTKHTSCLDLRWNFASSIDKMRPTRQTKMYAFNGHVQVNLCQNGVIFLVLGFISIM